MADKDLLEVLSEMFRKQDQQSELIGVTNTRIMEINASLVEINTSIVETNTRILETNNRILETNDILKEFMGVSIKQWDEQQKFNERLYDKVDGIEKQIVKISDLEDRIKRIETVVFKTP
jgi:tRNA(Phe) wybutosine-synthesizing methylase Tyw3